MDGDRACLQCHAKYADKISAHTHHAPESTGSRCYNCHMPNTTYGLLKAMRSHRIDVPSVAATVSSGRPNACNLCHLDKSLGWTARWLREQYGIESPALDADQDSIESTLWLGLTGDAGQRALIAWTLGWPPAQAASDHAFIPALLGTLRCATSRRARCARYPKSTRAISATTSCRARPNDLPSRSAWPGSHARSHPRRSASACE
jgi:hypothetical protein